MRPLVIAMAVAVAAWPFARTATEARCSYFAKYPAATGRLTFMLATATADTVSALPDSLYAFRVRPVPAQVMQVSEFAGYQEEALSRGLRASGGSAVFVRYEVGISCAPHPAADGALDSVGVNGLYVGLPRPEDRWVGGRPTFDIHRAVHYPLPQRLNAPSGHFVAVIVPDRPTMTAPELFAMYRTLWAESVTVDDRSVEHRIRRWIELDPAAAVKHPTADVAWGMVAAVSDARVAAYPVPFGGTFEITVVVPGVDSLVTYGQSFKRARPWMGDVVSDSVTGLPLASHFSSFAVDIQTAPSAAGFVRETIHINPCPPIVTVVGALPIVPGADSAWQGEMHPMGFLECAPEGSPLAELVKPGTMRDFNPGPALVTFRRHPDGRVTFEARTHREGSSRIVVRGERISAAAYGPPWDQ